MLTTGMIISLVVAGLGIFGYLMLRCYDRYEPFRHESGERK
jgi:hypothetical protein